MVSAAIVRTSLTSSSLSNLSFTNSPFLSKFQKRAHLESLLREQIETVSFLTPLELQLSDVRKKLTDLQSLKHAIDLAAEFSLHDFEKLINLLKRGEIWNSPKVFNPENIIQRLVLNQNFILKLGGVSFECNRVIAASLSGNVSRFVETHPKSKEYSVVELISSQSVSHLNDLLKGQKIACKLSMKESILELHRVLDLVPFRGVLNEMETEEIAIVRELKQLSEIAVFQKEIDCLNGETFPIVINQICEEFKNDTRLWQSIVRMAAHLHPKQRFLFEQLVEQLKSQYGLPQTTLYKELESSEFLDIVKSDDVEELALNWKSLQWLQNAIPIPNSSALKSLGISEPSQIENLASVVAFYGAVKCLRFLIANTSLALMPSNVTIDPLCFAIAGGNSEAIKLLENSRSSPKVRILFAVYYHQQEIFDWLMSSYSVNENDSWLFEGCIVSGWFYGLYYCYEKGILKPISSALEQAAINGNYAIFRFLLLFIDLKSPPDFSLILPNIIRNGDFQMTQLVLALIAESNFFSMSKCRMQIPLSSFRYDCLIYAIQTHSIDFVNLIWEPLGIDELLLDLLPNQIALAHAIKQTENRQIIQKFLKYGNIFQGIASIMDWLDFLAEKGKINVIDMITNGEKEYFKYFPRNPLPYAANIETARYLLEHGADPNYKGANGFSLLHRAIRNNDKAMQELVKQYGGTVTQQVNAVLRSYSL
jgi:ankyrin repeat protein